MNKIHYKTKFSQNGAALITCLALLLVLTLIGLSSINTTALEEKMAGSVLNNNIAWNAAEAVLIEAERDATLNGVPATIPNGGKWNLTELVKPGDANYPVWSTTPDADWIVATSQLNVSNDNFAPSYLIEKYSTTSQTAQLKAGKINEEQVVYRVTARSEGLNSNSTVMLQSTVRVLGGL